MGQADSKTTVKNENIEHLGKASTKKFSSNEAVKLEPSFTASTFSDNTNSEKSNSQNLLNEAESLGEETPELKAPSSKPRSKVFNGIYKRNIGFSKFSRNRDTKVLQNFVGKFKNKISNVDEALNAKTETSYLRQSSSGTDRQKKLQPANDSLKEEAEAKKGTGFKGASENVLMQLEIFVDGKGSLKVNLSDGKKPSKLSHVLLKKNDKNKSEMQLNHFATENVRKEINLKSTEKEENVEQTILTRSKRRNFCKLNAKNIENLGIKKSQEVILLQNLKPKVKHPDAFSSKAFRKQFCGNKYDENIISLENLMLTSKGNELQNKEFGRKCNSKNIIKFEGHKIAIPKVSIRKSTIKSSLEIINLEPISESFPESEFPVHKVLIRACSKGSHVKFDNPFSMFDMIIPEQLKRNSKIYKNSSVSMNSYTSQATENDVSDFDEAASSSVATSGGILKSFTLSTLVGTEFCSSSELSDDSKVSKKSLQRMQGLTSFSINDSQESEYLFALEGISNPSAKLTYLLELKYKKKFKTLEELYQRPIDMINFLQDGELFEPTELEPIESFISYEEILNSLVSGI